MSIQSIDHPGGSGLVSTGALRFRGDWPGLFIRGDECMGLFDRLNAVFKRAEENPTEGLKLFRKILDKYLKIMEEDVFVFETES